MLSYMLSVDEKPPSGPGKGHLQLAFSSEPLTNGRTPISKENSVSSFASDATTATASHSSITPTSISDKVKPKLLINGAKHQTLKRMFSIFNYFVEIEEEEHRLRELRLEKRRIRDNSNPFELPDLQFKRLFRLNKELCQNLIEAVTPFMDGGIRSSRIPIITRVLVVLRFFATVTTKPYMQMGHPSFLFAYISTCGIGEEYLTSVSQQSVSNCIAEVGTAIQQLSPWWIQFPTNNIDKQNIKAEFMQKFGFPGIIGVIDCTHVSILEPFEHEHLYFNQKGYHSKNCQIICDSNLIILNVNANFGGASHDSFIWRQSAVCREMERSYLAGERNSWLLVDSGYPQQPWLMIPVHNPPEGSPGARFNEVHKIARNTVERCIGTLKTRFRCLLKERVLRYSPFKVGIIINACSILHNMCMRGGLPLDDEEIIYDDDNNLVNHDVPHDFVEDGRRARNNLINLYFVE